MQRNGKRKIQEVKGLMWTDMGQKRSNWRYMKTETRGLRKRNEEGRKKMKRDAKRRRRKQ